MTRPVYRVILSTAVYLTCAIGCPAIAAQRLVNFGQRLSYERSLTVYDTVDRETSTYIQIDSFTDDGALDFGAPTAPGGGIGVAQPIVGVGELTFLNNGFASTTFDIKALNRIIFAADTIGTYNEETAPDGVWDFIEARSVTTFAMYDVVTVLPGPGQESGTPGTFFYHWTTSGNTLDTEVEAALGPVVDTPFGPLALPLGGFLSTLR